MNEVKYYFPFLFQGSSLSQWSSRKRTLHESASFMKLFRGEICQTTTCGKCKHKSLTTQLFMDLQLDIINANSIEEALALKFLLSDNPQYRCQWCLEESEASVMRTISVAPPILCFQLMR